MPLIALICTWLFVPWSLLFAWLNPAQNTIPEQLDKAIEWGATGIIVFVDKSGSQPELFAAGLQNKEQKVPMNPQSLFKIASISKLYIAAATAKLVAKDSLALDDTLSEMLPSRSKQIENAEEITLRMLIQHRSGIPDYIRDKDFPWDRSVTEIDELLEYVLDDPSDFEPNSQYQYSNTNYVLLGLILDKTLGYSHHEYIREELLEPLKLTKTFSLFSDVSPDEVVSGYLKGQEYTGDVKLLDFVAPGGSMVSTAEEVGIFLRALATGKLLNEREQEIYSSVYPYEHTGLLPGYQSIARYHKDIDTVVVQFINTSDSNMWGISEIVYNDILKIIRKDG